MKTRKLCVLAAAVILVPSAHAASGPRSESKTYNAQGLLAAVDGARTDISDVTHYGYDEGGRLASVTDALGHVTRYAGYDTYGNPGLITDVNQVTTRLTYTPEGWLATSTRDVGGSPFTSTIEYDAVGDVIKTTDADGVVVDYVYDDARRLTEVIDGGGNRIRYTLDAAGNRLKEQTLDGSGQVRRKVSRTFNSLSQLMSVLDGMDRIVLAFDIDHGYDAAGHPLESEDAAGIRRRRGYDALGRLVSMLENYGGTEEATHDTQTVTSFDAAGNVDGISDPEGLDTLYVNNGLGDLTEQNSPDTGTTAYVYDTAGNLIKATDARGIVTAYAYDALNRRVSASYEDTSSDVQWVYDESDATTGCEKSYPAGRLTRVIEQAVTTVYCYDASGYVAKKRQVQGVQADTISYAYTAGGRLAQIGRPDGGVTTYTRDRLGRITTVSDISASGESKLVADQVTYLPFGPVASYVLGNGQSVTRIYDLNYAVTDIVGGAFELHLTRDTIGRVVESHSVDAPLTETYRYDALSRLRSVNGPDADAAETFTYNRTGDRLSKSGNGVATGNYGYQQGTHRLASVGLVARLYDAAGNMTANTLAGEAYALTYGARNRLSSVTRGGALVGTYVHNAAGQRVAKSVTEPSVETRRFVYDESSFLVGEEGKSSRAYIWMDDVLVGIADSGADVQSLSYVYTDGLGSPRVVANENGGVVWQWSYSGNPFGDAKPISLGYALNLRFPGQYFDAESSLAYNMHRSYDSSTGRYVQGDPVGLSAGPSAYAYGSSAPLDRTDRFGLDDGYCRINPSWCGWPIPRRSVANGTFGVNETGVAAVLGEQAETGVAFDTTPNVCIYSKICGMAATGVGSGGSAGISIGVGTGALSSGRAHTASFGAQTGAGVLSGAAVDVDVLTGQISLSRGFLGAGGGAYVGMFVCRTVTQCVREPEASRQNGCE
jgi:RHS repeat-associated protein